MGSKGVNAFSLGNSEVVSGLLLRFSTTGDVAGDAFVHGRVCLHLVLFLKCIPGVDADAQAYRTGMGRGSDSEVLQSRRG